MDTPSCSRGELPSPAHGAFQSQEGTVFSMGCLCLHEGRNLNHRFITPTWRRLLFPSMPFGEPGSPFFSFPLSLSIPQGSLQACCESEQLHCISCLPCSHSDPSLERLGRWPVGIRPLGSASRTSGEHTWRRLMCS